MSEKKDDLDIGAGLLAMLASGPILGGKMAEAEYTVCEDCKEWDNSTGTIVGAGCGRCWISMQEQRPDGPLWPGCRGFKLRDGAKGPRMRSHEAAGRAYVEARRAAAAVDADEMEEKR